MLKHVVVSEMIGIRVANCDNPLINNLGSAFTLGMASHALMDLVEPDFTVNWFNMPALRMAYPFLLLQIFGLYFVFRMMLKKTGDRPQALMFRLAAIAGGIAPDIIDGIYTVINPQAWYNGQLLFPWHRLSWQVNLMSMWSTMLLTVSLILVRYLTLPFYRIFRPRLFINRDEKKIV